MAGIGIIAEFNPLHKGHEYLINKAMIDIDREFFSISCKLKKEIK